MKLPNRKFLFLVVLAGIAISAAACTKTENFAAVNIDGEGVALKGFDAVAYFAVEKAVEGSPRYEYAWHGAKWLFANAANLEKFKQNPEAYAPQYGGYCSYAVSKGYTADGDPNAWKIVDGKLYLNYNLEVKEMWETDQQQNIKKGEEHWVEFKTKKPEHKGK
ncbi:MAG: YHS domain protein [Acidobacteria bacterium]|nr:YHS domain protein [Acidobacteriota bacterium]